jgi:hypothetical protein
MSSIAARTNGKGNAESVLILQKLSALGGSTGPSREIETEKTGVVIVANMMTGEGEAAVETGIEIAAAGPATEGIETGIVKRTGSDAVIVTETAIAVMVGPVIESGNAGENAVRMTRRLEMSKSAPRGGGLKIRMISLHYLLLASAPHPQGTVRGAVLVRARDMAIGLAGLTMAVMIMMTAPDIEATGTKALRLMVNVSAKGQGLRLPFCECILLVSDQFQFCQPLPPQQPGISHLRACYRRTFQSR